MNINRVIYSTLDSFIENYKMSDTRHERKNTTTEALKFIKGATRDRLERKFYSQYYFTRVIGVYQTPPSYFNTVKKVAKECNLLDKLWNYATSDEK